MTNTETARDATVPPPMSRAAKAEALLLRFTAEAHRRKWNYDRGLDGDGVPVKSEAFDALHRLGEEMRVALEELRRMPAAVSVPPPAPRADDQAALRDRIAAAIRAFDFSDYGMDDVSYALEADPDAQEWVPSLADAVLAVLPPTADRAAVIAATARACAEHLRDTYSDMWTADAARSLELHAARIERGEPTALLRRMADEAQQPAPHSCPNCEGIDPDTCLMNPARPADSRPRCPDCQMPHDLTPSMALACASIRDSIADHHPDVSGPCVAGEQQNETPEAEVEQADTNDALVEEYLRFLRGLGPEPDLSDLPSSRRRAITGQFEIIRALADRDPELPPLERDPVARRLGLTGSDGTAAGVRQDGAQT